MKKLLLALLLFPSIALAAPLWGIDHLGGARYVDVIAKSHPPGYAIGVFTQRDLFGDGLRAAEAGIKRGAPLVRYNLAWSDAHQFPEGQWSKIIAEARRVGTFASKYPSVGCMVSGATEHQLNATLAQRLATRILAAIPSHCVYVNNPWEGRGAFIPSGPRVVNEVHGHKANPPRIGGRFTYSYDGSDAFDYAATPIKNRMRNAEVFFFWTSQNNGRRNAGDSTPRPQRKFWPTEKLIKALAFLATDQGNVALPRNYLVKPKSDQHVVPPAPRELKPVLIFPGNAERIILRASRVSFQSEKAVPFADGRRRYYFPKFGYEMVEEAKTPVFEVLAGKKRLGTANPAFRQGGDR